MVHANLPNYEKIDKPWGNFERLTHNEQSTVKLITVTAGNSISLQSHEHRGEYWRIISGIGRAIIDEEVIPVEAGVELFIKPTVKHRIESTTDDILFLEIAFGTFDESDITRFSDQYGRV